MGTSLKGIPILLCTECSQHINKVRELVQGSPDPNDVRCPQCGSSSFICGYCFRAADRFALDSGDITWNCDEGCNP